MFRAIVNENRKAVIVQGRLVSSHIPLRPKHWFAINARDFAPVLGHLRFWGSVFVRTSAAARECCSSCNSKVAIAWVEVFWICPTMPMDPLLDLLEVSLEVLWKDLDCHRADLLLLLAAEGLNLGVVVVLGPPVLVALPPPLERLCGSSPEVLGRVFRGVHCIG